MHESGLGVDGDRETTIKYMKLAAQSGHAAAIHWICKEISPELGNSYEQYNLGITTSTNENQIFRFFFFFRFLLLFHELD